MGGCGLQLAVVRGLSVISKPGLGVVHLKRHPIDTHTYMHVYLVILKDLGHIDFKGNTVIYCFAHFFFLFFFLF